jgi:glycosyltransferase involved in cell wall biosynthesis
MRVSIIEPSGLLYGSELALVDLLGGLDRARFEFEVILPNGSPLRARLEQIDVECYELLSRRHRRFPRLQRVVSYARILVHWMRHRPALVYVNQGGALRPIAWLTRVLALPVVCQIQTVEDALWVSSLRRLHRNVMAFICNSQFTARQTSVPKGRLCIVYPAFQSRTLGSRAHKLLRNDAFRIAVIGRVCADKGHRLMVEAARILLEATAVQVTFVVIGDPANECEQTWVDSVQRDADLRERVAFRGYRADLAAELRDIHAIAIPSIVPETFGRVLIEAAEARIPAIVPDIGGLGELSHRFGVGVRYRCGDSRDFAQKVVELHANYDDIAEHFCRAGEQMLRSLAIAPYVEHLSAILQGAAQWTPSAMQWLGEPQPSPE